MDMMAAKSSISTNDSVRRKNGVVVHEHEEISTPLFCHIYEPQNISNLGEIFCHVDILRNKYIKYLCNLVILFVSL